MNTVRVVLLETNESSFTFRRLGMGFGESYNSEFEFEKLFTTFADDPLKMIQNANLQDTFLLFYELDQNLDEERLEHILPKVKVIKAETR